MSRDQHWRIVATPEQRHGLCQLIHGEKVVVAGSEGRRLRRCVRALGLGPIRDELVRAGAVDDDMVRDHAPAVFTVTAENVDFIKRILDTAERKPAVELAIGELADVIEEMPAVAPPEIPEGVPDYDPAAESWAVKSDRAKALQQLDEAIADMSPEQLRRLAAVADEMPEPPPAAENGKGAQA